MIETPVPRRGERVDDKPVRSGIDKRPVDGPVRVEPLGLVGDAILDTAHHGGLLQAVYAYAVEDQEWWTDQLGDELTRPITPGSFGENLTLAGVAVNDARAGERWAMGSVVLEVVDPRIPCSTFAGFMGVPHWVKRFAAAERPGAYLRVVTPGEVRAGDGVTVTPGPEDAPTIREMFARFYRR
ncbi:MAG TPA: MOSC domain-containing protein [Nocardioides sp.]|nr:MOSC domain-containing protein [Nocardioides sp.]